MKKYNKINNAMGWLMFVIAAATYLLTNRAQDELPTDAQLALYNIQPLHKMGYHGQGILITVCDGGFTNANKE